MEISHESYEIYVMMRRSFTNGKERGTFGKDRTAEGSNKI